MRQNEWEDWAKSIDAALGGEVEALSMLAELASGLFPNGLPEFTRLTWAESSTTTSSSEAARSATPHEGAESRLRAAEARFRALVEQIPAVTFMAVLGEGKNEVYVSPHIEQMLGYSQDEWLSDPFLWYWRLHPEDRVLWNEEFARGCRVGGPFRADCRFIARDGRVVWVHGEARVVRDDLGRPLFLQGVAFDISDIKRAQEMMVTEAVRRAKLEEELAIARRVQMSILPRNLEVKGLEIAAKMITAEDVGGDYYDVQPTAEGCWLAIGDVAGHGLDAGLIMLMVQAATSSIARMKPNATPRELLTQLNELLFENIRRRLGGDAHVTFTLGRFKRDGTLLFAGAHEDIIVVRAAEGSVEILRPPGTWLGARADIRRVTVDAMVTLEPGDLVVLYTDGITEARNDSRAVFDLWRLRDSVVARRHEPVEQIRDGVFADVAAWSRERDDDQTLVIVRYTGA